MDTVYIIVENIYFDFNGPIVRVIGSADTLNLARRILESETSVLRESDDYSVGKEEMTKDSDGREGYCVRFDYDGNPGDYYEYHIVPETLHHDTGGGA